MTEPWKLKSLAKKSLPLLCLLVFPKRISIMYYSKYMQRLLRYPNSLTLAFILLTCLQIPMKTCNHLSCWWETLLQRQRSYGTSIIQKNTTQIFFFDINLFTGLIDLLHRVRLARIKALEGYVVHFKSSGSMYCPGYLFQPSLWCKCWRSSICIRIPPPESEYIS